MDHLYTLKVQQSKSSLWIWLNTSTSLHFNKCTKLQLNLPEHNMSNTSAILAAVRVLMLKKGHMQTAQKETNNKKNKNKKKWEIF